MAVIVHWDGKAQTGSTNPSLPAQPAPPHQAPNLDTAPQGQPPAARPAKANRWWIWVMVAAAPAIAACIWLWLRF